METKRPATYQDVLDAPEHMVAELIDGELSFLRDLEDRTRSWRRFWAANCYRRFFVAAVGRAGGSSSMSPSYIWRVTVSAFQTSQVGDANGCPTVPDDHKFTIRPDWVCEVASKSTEKLDRFRKLPAYARVGVGHAWLIHPGYRTLEVLRLVDGKWSVIDVFADADVVRAEPFEAIELDLAGLWNELPVRASEGYAQYGEAPY